MSCCTLPAIPDFSWYPPPVSIGTFIQPDTRSSMVKALELFEDIPEAERDRILLALCVYFGHSVV